MSSDESAVTSFAKLTSYCFYLPTGVMGPLITYKKYHDSLSAAVRPLDRGWLRSALLQSYRYLLLFCVSDISLYFFYQQSLALHVSQLILLLSFENRKIFFRKWM